MNWKSSDPISDLQRMVDKIRSETQMKRTVKNCPEISHLDKMDFEAFLCLIFTTDLICSEQTFQKMKEYGMLEKNYKFSGKAKERARKWLNQLII